MWTSKASATPRLINLVASLLVLEERLVIERSAPNSPIPDSLRGVYRLAEGTSRKATRTGDDRVAAKEWNMSFRIQWDEMPASHYDVQALLEFIRKWVGIGGGRSLGYGRFVVHAFSIEVISADPCSTDTRRQYRFVFIS